MLFNKKKEENQNLEETKDQNVVEEKEMGTFAKLKEKKNRVFNIFYVISTAISFMYYCYYVYSTVSEKGFNNPLMLQNVVSILLVISMVAYALILIVSAIMSSSVKSAKGRIKKASVYLGYFKKCIKILSTTVSIIVLVGVFAEPGDRNFFALAIAAIQLIMNILNLMFKVFSLTTKVGVSVTKSVFKSARAKRKAKKLAEKEAKKQAKIAAKK